MKKYVIAVCIIVILVILCLIGYYVYKNTNMNTNPEAIRAKTNEEIRQLDLSIVTMLNNFNHISYTNYQVTESTIPSPSSEGGKTTSGASSPGGESSGGEESQSESSSSGSENETMENSSVEAIGILTNQDKKIDWDTLKQETELMYATWPITLIDLNSLNVNGEQLLQYTNTLDKVTKSLEDENKNEAMRNLSDLHSLLSIYTAQYSNDNHLTNILKIRGYIVKAYALAEEDNWDEMKKNITDAKNEYTKLLNNIQNTNNISNINKGYIILNELEKNTNNRDKTIFYVNYKNVMQELESLI